MKLLKKIALVLGLAAIAVGAWKLYAIEHEYSQGDNAYAALESLVTPAAVQETAPTAEPEVPETVPEETAALEETVIPEASEEQIEPAAPAISFPEVDFEALRRINPGTVGWIFCEDTPINYPIAQAGDNRYYLEHLFTGEQNGSGCIFLDCANQPDFSDEHSILYGHNMNNGSMFAALMKYKQQAFFDAHPRFLLMTPEQNYTVEIFAGYVLSGWGDAWRVAFPDAEDFARWVEESIGRSCFRSDVRPGPEDRVVTLSTCTYEFDDARFVLLGILKQA